MEGGHHMRNLLNKGGEGAASYGITWASVWNVALMSQPRAS